MSKITKNRWAILALAGLSAIAVTEPATAAGMMVDSDGGLEVFELGDTNYWFKITGRLFLDNVWFDDHDNAAYSFPNGAQVRSALVTLRGGVGGNWVYKLDINFQDAEGNPGRTQFGEAFVGYNPCPSLWFAFGQISVPFGLEAWASASDTPLMELSLPSQAFAPDNGLGIYAEWHGNYFTAAGTVYHPPAGSTQYGDNIASPPVIAGFRVPGSGYLGSQPGSDPWSVGARVTFAPIHDDHTVVHTGVSGRHDKVHDSANYLNYFARTELRSRQSPTIFSNIPPNSSDSDDVWGFELAGRWGPYILQGEYMLAHVNRPGSFPVNDWRNPGGDQNYNGYYIMGSWVVTGETKDYDFDSGTFGKVKPKCSKGAWELIARYSYLDLQGSYFPKYFKYVDQPQTNFPTGTSPNDIVGGAHSAALGVTWWVSENIRLMANYVYMDLPLEDVNGLGIRAQVRW